VCSSDLEDLLEVIRLITITMDGMKEE